MKTVYAVSALIIKDGKILIQKHVKLGKLSLPSGKIDKGETPPAAMRREILEELGVSKARIHDCKIYKHKEINTVEYNYIVELYEDWYNAEPEKHEWIDWLTPDEITSKNIPLAHTVQFGIKRMIKEELC